MNRSHKIVAFLLVVGSGIYGCAKNPTGNARSDSGTSTETKAQRWEDDFKAAAAARDQYRQKLLAAEEKHAQLQKTLDHERAVAVAERDSLKAELKIRSNERDLLQSQYDGFRRGIKDLLAQAETLANPNIPNIPTIPAPPTTSPTPALVGSQPSNSNPTTPGSALSN